MEGTRLQAIEANLKENEVQFRHLFEQQQYTNTKVQNIQVARTKLEQHVQYIAKGVNLFWLLVQKILAYYGTTPLMDQVLALSSLVMSYL